MPAPSPNSIRRDDFSREIMLDCTRDGTITTRNRKDRLPDGVLPFFSVNTTEEAETLILRLCKAQYDDDPQTRRPRYRYPHLGTNMSLEDMDVLSDIFRTAWYGMKDREAMAAETARQQLVGGRH